MSKNLVVNVDYIKTTLLGTVTKTITKLESTYKIFNTIKIPPNFQMKDSLLKDKEKMYLTIKSLNDLKNRLNTIIKKYEVENNLAIDDILSINHFLLNIKK